jgi:hypothetical protein
MSLTKVCLDCHEEKPLEAFRLCYAGLPKPNRPDYAERNPAGMRQNRCKLCYSRRERAQRKLDFLKSLGSKCACCGEDDHRFLSLDHVQNDGNEHREHLVCHQIYGRAKREGYPSDKYQVLCYNCNMGKSTNGGVCPHQSAVSKDQAWKILEEKETYIGRGHVDTHTNGSQKGFMAAGFDARRMQLGRRVLKPCKDCGKEFGTNEMVRHRRAEHPYPLRGYERRLLAKHRK